MADSPATISSSSPRAACDTPEVTLLPQATAFPVDLPGERAGHDQSTPPARKGWLVGPWFDALFVANIAWPLLFWIGFAGEGFDGREGLQFWQIYFVTTPHRWITLLVVFFDRERFHERRGTFLGLAATVVAGCLGLLLTTGSLMCLLAAEYAWNIWHFAAQHHGIYRLYGRLGSGGASVGLRSEKWVMRGFLLYVMGRVAGGTWSIPRLESTLLATDCLMLAPAVWLLASDLRTTGPELRGRSLYLASVLLLYGSLLWAAHNSRPRLLLALTTASALFHAMEYLALISWSVDRRVRERGGRLGWMARFAAQWGLFLAIYVATLGAGGWLVERRWFNLWLVLNLMAAFLHYAYDGLIWRKPARAAGAAPVAAPGLMPRLAAPGGQP